MEHEYEAKALISEEHFNYLLKTLEPIDSLNQSNTYLDTQDGFFKSKKSALRLREINGEQIFSLKTQNNDGASEWNCRLSNLDYQQILQSKSIDLNKFDCPFNEHLTNLNTITIFTTRHRFKYMNHIIELDKTRFNKTVDFEIEIEATDMKTANDILLYLVKEFNLDTKKSYPKIARYFMYN